MELMEAHIPIAWQFSVLARGAGSAASPLVGEKRTATGELWRWFGKNDWAAGLVEIANGAAEFGDNRFLRHRLHPLNSQRVIGKLVIEKCN